MKNYWFDVFFKTGKTVKIYAGDFKSAEILAQAEQIKAGNDYIVLSVTMIKQ